MLRNFAQSLKELVATRLSVRTSHLNPRGVRQHAHVLEEPRFDFVQVLWCVLIGHVGRTDV